MFVYQEKQRKYLYDNTNMKKHSFMTKQKVVPLFGDVGLGYKGCFVCNGEED